MTMTILVFSDKHPVVATAFSACLAVMSVAAYRTVALVVGACMRLLGRLPRPARTMKQRTERPPAAMRTARSPKALVPSESEAESEAAARERDVRSALSNLGYVKAEVQPVLAGLDMSAPVPVVLRAAIMKLKGASPS